MGRIGGDTSNGLGSNIFLMKRALDFEGLSGMELQGIDA